MFDRFDRYCKGSGNIRSNHGPESCWVGPAVCGLDLEGDGYVDACSMEDFVLVVN
jgi:hypothetical protein